MISNDWLKVGRGRREACLGTWGRDWRRADVKTGMWGREIGDACCIAEKQKKVTFIWIEKADFFQRNGANIGYFPINPLDLPITDNTRLFWIFAPSIGKVRLNIYWPTQQ